MSLDNQFPAVKKPTQFERHMWSGPDFSDEDGTQHLLIELNNEVYESQKAVSKQLDLYLMGIADALGLTVEELAERFVLEVHHLNDIDVSVDGERFGLFPDNDNQLVFQLKYEYRLVPKEKSDG